MKFRYSFFVAIVYYCLIKLGQSSIHRNINKIRHKRLINQPNQSYQECRTPTGRVGHCKHIQHCPLPEIRQNNLQFLDHLCIIHSTVGVCCPEGNIKYSTISFPQRADEADGSEAATGNYCGLSTKSYSKITGGRLADPNEWPWMAAILRRDFPRVFCGGVLITDRHILTAAHCTDKYNKNDLTVRLGEYNYGQKNETRARDFRVDSITSHIDFDATTYDNDICIIKIHQPVVFNSYVWPVCMPPSDDTFEDYVAIITGWGSQSFGGPSSDILMEVSVPIWKQDDCQNVFIERIGEHLICAGAPEGGRDSCQGDSGGPLLVQLPNKRWIVAGIISYGIGCGGVNRPGVYTRVSSYSSWIVENATF